MTNETKKILDNDIDLTATCVRITCISFALRVG
jgi:aspartate-semialdehyde dehydrogenase